MKAHGGLVCASAGNYGDNMSTAPTDAIITVSATDSGDNLAGWSSYGDVVDVAAPGVGLWTTLNGGGFGKVSGTSFSSPATAAVVALVMARNPSLSPAQVEDVIESTAADLGAPGKDIYFGYGRVDAGAAVLAADESERHSTGHRYAVTDGVNHQPNQRLRVGDGTGYRGRQ